VTITSKDVAEITRLLEASSFDELHLESDGLKLDLRRHRADGTVPYAASESESRPEPDPVAPEDAAAPRAAADAAIEDVVAPLLGTFYRAPKPGAPPFIESGRTVVPDTVIGIIEVMKLMNTVRAGVSGTITEILARDGELVEYGETLCRVRKPDPA
jgi:acetyl-CoA carboxylase biotin carboxyl carrier protein